MLLNCSPENGSIVTENTATVNFYGSIESIADIYNKAKVTDESGVHFNISGAVIGGELAPTFYEALWWVFFNANKDLAEQIRSYDGYIDSKPVDRADSTARVFNILKMYGLSGLHVRVKKFLCDLFALVHTKDKEPDAFGRLMSLAKDTVSRGYGERSKEELLDSACGDTFLVRLIDVLYDEKDGCISESYKGNMLLKIKEEFAAN